MMRLVLLSLALLLVSAMAFKPMRAIKATKTTSKAMSMKSESFKPMNFIPAALVPLAMPMMTLAAEGTSRAFGVDDGRLIWAALLPSFIIFPLYNKWSKEQEADDFFDGYEKRRNG